MENERGITVLKWKDKRDVLMLSTKHSNEFCTVQKKNGKSVRKPKMVVAYDKAKGTVDLGAYSSPLRKTVILNTAVVNAWIM